MFFVLSIQLIKLNCREALSIFDKLDWQRYTEISMYPRQLCFSKVHGNSHVPSPFVLLKGTREFARPFAICATQRYTEISMYLRRFCLSKVHGNFHVRSPFVLLKGTREFPRPFAICATQRYTEISMYFNTEAR